jgi:hypothetical protein
VVFDVDFAFSGKFWNSVVFNDLFIDQEKKRPLLKTGKTRSSDFEQTKAAQRRKATTLQ